MRHRTLALSLLFMVTLFWAKPVHATILVTDEYPTSNRDSFSSIAEVHPGVNSAQGQAFTSVYAGFIIQAQFFLSRTAIIEGELQAFLYTLTGTYGSSSGGAVPDATVASSARSNVIALSSFPDNQYVLVNFTFPQGGYRLSSGSTYGIAVVAISGDFAGGGNLVVGLDNSSPTHGGNRFGYSTSVGGWASSSGDDIFSVTVDTSETFGGGGGGGGGSGDEGGDGQPPAPTALAGGSLLLALVAVGAIYWFSIKGKGRK